MFQVQICIGICIAYLYKHASVSQSCIVLSTLFKCIICGLQLIAAILYGYHDVATVAAE